MKKLRMAAHVLLNPGGIFRYRSMRVRSYYSRACKLLHPITYSKRRRLGRRIYSTKKTFDINDADGFLVVPPDSSPLVSEVVTQARKCFAEKHLAMLQDASRKEYLQKVLTKDDLDADSPFVRLGLDPFLVGAVAKYLGVLPILHNIEVWYSPNTKMRDGSSQYFHLDHEDVRQIKAFIFVEDVTLESGPLTVLRASTSQKVWSTIGYRMTAASKRVEDHVVYDLVGKDEIHPLVGKSGTMALVDTSRCFHFGSREAIKPRLVVMIQYLSPFAFTVPWLWWKSVKMHNVLRPDTPKLERQILGAR